MAGEQNNQTDANGWTPELLKKRRRRALIMALALLGLVGMFFLVTLVRLGENVANRAAREKTEISDVKKYLNNTQVDTSRSVIVEFDSNTHGPWEFKPENSSITLHPGELITVNFKISNPSNYPISGQAIPSYAPLQATKFLKKIECFCFTEQVLEPGQRVDMPVSFFVDPEILTDPEMDDVKTITLSYTFFKASETARAKPASPRG